MPGASPARRSAAPNEIRSRGGERLHARLGPVADAPARGVEDAPDAHGVVGVGDRAQVGQRVADLLALVEAHPADDLVRQAEPDEDLLEDPGLGVGAVEDGHVAGAGARRRRPAGRSRGPPSRPRRARCRRRSRRSARRRPGRSTGAWACGRCCGRSPRWPRRGSSGWSGSSAPAGSCARRGSRARTPGCCGWSRPGTRRSTGRRRRPRTARPAAPPSAPTSSLTSTYCAWLVSWYSSTSTCRNRRR